MLFNAMDILEHIFIYVHAKMLLKLELLFFSIKLRGILKSEYKISVYILRVKSITFTFLDEGC